MSRASELLLLLLLLSGIAIARGEAASSSKNNVTDGPHSCGGVDVPFPFGIADGDGRGDFRRGFDLACEAGKPVLTNDSANISFAIGNFSIETAEARVWLPVGWQCYNASGNRNGSEDYTTIQFSDQGAYRISNARNNFFVLGCATIGFLRSKPLPDAAYTQLAGCASYCVDPNSMMSGACSGVGCCHADIPTDLVDNRVSFDDSIINNALHTVKFSPCDYAFLAEKDNYTFHTDDLNMDLHRSPRLMPVTLDWAIRDKNLTCNEASKEEGYACISSKSRCLNATNGPGYICNCSQGYQGNPYVLDGCTDINECDHPDHYPCVGICKNKQGSYQCTCDRHSNSADPFKEPCKPNWTQRTKIAIGSVLIVFIVVIIVFIWILAEEKKKIREIFKKNGGPILKEFNCIKLFSKEDLKKILKGSNIIGKGRYGKVYKGHIKDDNQTVAVKVPVNSTSTDRDQFVNEIRIQCQVSHQNIVKLVGCCLEVGVPRLVYEFVPKGSLHDILHGNNMMTLSMNRRLQIAAESAQGLAYLHLKTPTPVLHGDVKPENILLDDDLTPKISDFGISKLIYPDVKHTGLVIDDKSYMDPVFMQTGLLSEKSDVYSFGVVLLELITRKKSLHSETNNLLGNFLNVYKKDKYVTELVDKELEVNPELLESLTGMINQCLNLNVNERPEMTVVANRLSDMVKRLNNE